MMEFDKRESKLPVWAKELMEAERIKSSVGFPNISKPEPDAIATSSDRFDGLKFDGMWTSGEEYTNQYRYNEKSMSNSPNTSGRHTFYFNLESNARLYRLWLIAESHAQKMYVHYLMYHEAIEKENEE